MRAYLSCLALVAAICGTQVLFGFKPEISQAISVPVVFAFQYFVLAKPIREIWTRVQPAGLNRVWVLSTVVSATAAVVAYSYLTEIRGAAVLIFALMGAVPLGLAAQATRLVDLRRAAPYFVLAVAAGVAVIHSFAGELGVSTTISAKKLVAFAAHFTIMFPGMFVVEEYIFRGCIDPALAEVRTGISNQIFSILCVSLLWALWHLPFDSIHTPAEFMSDLGLQLRAAMVFGPFLSLCVRRAGSLMLPCAAHAIVDAYRNALFSL